MQLVKTRNHLIYSGHSGNPSHACGGKCKKVWWREDVEESIAAAAVPACPQCGGPLSAATSPEHYTLVTENAEPMEIDGLQIKNAGLNLGS